MDSRAQRRVSTFIVVWLGQLFSVIGSTMTTFALGLWVLEQTGSTTQFTLIAFFGILPAVAGLPLAGALVDRWGARRTMLIADIGEGLTALVLAILLASGRLEIWQIYTAVFLGALFGALRRPAYATLPSLLVSTDRLARANGMTQASDAAATILAPLVAGFLMSSIGLWGVLLVDVTTYMVGVATLLVVRFGRADAPAQDEAEPPKSSLGSEMLVGWNYIRVRPGLWLLLIFFVITNFTVQGLAHTLFTPLVLSFSSKQVLGSLLSVGGIGLMAGALAMSLWGGPKRHIDGVLGTTLVQGLFIVSLGLSRSVMLAGVAIFVVSFCFPIVMGSSQALWQRKVPVETQGRVFSIRYMIGWSSFPIAYLVGGPLVDRVFEPLLAEGGALADSVGQMIGVGAGRGIAFLYILLGLTTTATALIGYQFDRLRLVQEELRDALPE